MNERCEVTYSGQLEMFSFEGFDPFGFALAGLADRRSKPVQDAFESEFFHLLCNSKNDCIDVLISIQR